MNLLKLISTLQGIVLVVLCVAVFQLSGKVDLVSSKLSLPAVPRLDQLENNSVPLALGNEQLRLLLREELQFVRDWSQASKQPEPSSAIDQGAISQGAIKNSPPAAIMAVDESIEYHLSVGSISEQEMGNLQMKIAKLDDFSRKAMFKKLLQAMNNGQLNGHL